MVIFRCVEIFVDLQEEKVQAKRCYISTYGANQALVENLTITKLRKGGGDVSIRFQSFAWNQESGHAEGFIEVHDTVSTKVLMERLTELGATCTGIVTFPNRDGDKTAASALNRIKSLSKSDGYVEVVRGECNAKLLKKAEELAEAERAAAELNHEFSEKTQAAIQLSQCRTD